MEANEWILKYRDLQTCKGPSEEPTTKRLVNVATCLVGQRQAWV